LYIFRELGVSNKQVFVTGHLFPPNYILGEYVAFLGQNCSFNLLLGEAYLALEKEHHYRNDTTYISIMQQLQKCEGQRFVQNLSSQISRLVVSNEVLIATNNALDSIKKVVDLAAPDKEFRISQEMLVHSVYIDLAQDLFQPEIWNLLMHLRDTGVFKYLETANRDSAFIKFWSNFKPNTTLVANLHKLGVNVSRRGVNIGPMKLKMIHIQTLVAMCMILELGAIILWTGEFGFNHYFSTHLT
jgi:hypothetical protein